VLAKPSSKRLQFITVVTFGRSGSTAIQSALNAHPQVLVRGENYNALTGLWRYWQSVVETADRHSAGKPDHPWFGSAKLDPQDVLADLRQQVVSRLLRPKKETLWTGFKEVRYEGAYFSNSASLTQYLLFLQELMPELRFLVNIRSPEKAARSGWWSEHPDAIASLSNTVEHLRASSVQLTQMLGNGRVQLVNHDEWNQDPGIIFEALTELGFPVNREILLDSMTNKLHHGQDSSDKRESGGP
jgi:hypothetical protein